MLRFAKLPLQATIHLHSIIEWVSNMSCTARLQGAIQEDQKPSDTVSTIACVVDPPSEAPKAIVVMVSDGFGWEFVNNRLLADAYAWNGGFRVYLSDFMDGAFTP